MIPVPHTYAEWINLLACFTQRENDEEVLLAMQSGTLEWQSGVAERFSKKLIDSVNERMNLACNIQIAWGRECNYICNFSITERNDISCRGNESSCLT